MPTVSKSTDRMNSNEAALALGFTRERITRLVQTGRLKGGVEDGRWWVDRGSVEALAAQFERQEIGAA